MLMLRLMLKLQIIESLRYRFFVYLQAETKKKRAYQASGDRMRFRRLHLAVDKRSGVR